MLQKAHRALQGELQAIKLDHVDINKMSLTASYRSLTQEKDFEQLLEEWEDHVTNAFNRMKKAESYTNECQVELGKIQVENSESDRLNVSDVPLMLALLSSNRYLGIPRTRNSVFRLLTSKQSHMQTFHGLRPLHDRWSIILRSLQVN